MPALYAHKSLADKVLNKLELPIKNIILKNKAVFYLGALGPDPLFYYKPLRGMPLYKKGSLIHDVPIYSILKDYKFTNEADLSYTLGFITHYIIDKNTHEYIPTIENEGYGHVKLESELEKYLIRADGLKIKKKLFISHLKPTKEDITFINKVLDVDLATYNKAIKGMRFCSKFFMSNNSLLKGFAKLALKLVGQYENVQDIFIVKKDDEFYKTKVYELQNIYNSSVDETVFAINNFYGYINNSNDLLEVFLKKY